MKIGIGTEVSPGAIIEQPENIIVGNNVKIKPGVVLRPETGKIYIGNNVVINHYTVIHAKGGVEIGDWSIISPHCSIMAQNHSFDTFDVPVTQQPNVGKGITLMGDNWLGTGSVILDGVTLGKGTVVGAGSIVTKSFSMGKVVAGNPARFLKNRINEGGWNFSRVERFSTQETPQSYWPYIQHRINFVLENIIKDDIILDIGCGEGYITDQMSKISPNIIGIDYSPEAIDCAAKRYPHIQFHEMPVTLLDFPDHSFDKIICLKVIEHLTILQAAKMLSEIYRVLKPGGVLLGSTPIRTTRYSEPGCYAHIYEYSQPELKHLLQLFSEVKIIDNIYFVGQK
jgi:acetyltransferase-like isoleucine patch superfamily enzyme